MKNFAIEGWRFIPHSYSVVNQFQCLELLKRSDIRLFHQDIVYYREAWQPVIGLFSEADETALKLIPSLSSDDEVDALLRITYPYNLKTSNAKQTCVFGTSELMYVNDYMLVDNSSLREAHLNSNCTILTPSHWSRAGFIRAGADPNRVVVVPLGIDSSIFKPLSHSERQELRYELGWEGFVFLNIGAITHNKGIHLLLKAFATVLETYPDAKLVLKGLDSLYSSEALLIQNMGDLDFHEAEKILSNLIYIGDTLPFSKVAQLYQAADAYVSPYFDEGFNMPVLEAAACGLPVICTKGGSTDDFTTSMFALYIESTLREVLIGSETNTGFLLVPEFEHLVELMKKIIGDQSFITQAQQMSHGFVKERFTWKCIVDQLLGVLNLEE